MSEAETPNEGQAPQPVAADEPALEDDLEKLVNEVESLTNDVLASTDSKAANGGEVPTRDPAKEPVADDAGLSAASPLVQDGDPTGVEEVVADVDHELDQMEKLIGSLGEPMDAQDDVADSVPSPAVESAGESASGVANAVPGLESPADDIADELPNTPATAAASPEQEIAGQIPATPEQSEAPASRTEKVLDQDLDALLAPPDEGAEPPLEASDLLADSESEPAEETSPEPLAAKPQEQPIDSARPSAADVEDLPLWQILKSRLLARIRRLRVAVGSMLLNGVLALLERIDARIGQRLPPMVKELIGYCALGTLGMCVVALLVWIL